MANEFYIPKAHLITGICLPLALLIGYLLAEPTQLSSLAVVGLVVGILFLPLLFKGYYYLLLFSCFSVFGFMFLAGSPPLWLLAVVAGFLCAVVNRCVDPDRRLMVGGGVAWSLLALAGVVGVTALFTGGVGLRTLGSSYYGGRHYMYVLGGILAYFTLAGYRVPASQATFCSSLFFLSGVTAVLALVPYAFPHTYSVLSYFMACDPGGPISDFFNSDVARFGGLGAVCFSGCYFLLLRYGLGGVLDFSRAWRAGLMVLFLGGGLCSGYRSFPGLMALVIGVSFFAEGLYRSRHLLQVAGLAVVCGLLLVVFAPKLPLTAQRALSFLPVEVQPAARISAQNSSDWRLEMWETLLRSEVPKRLFKGRGYAINSDALALAQYKESRGEFRYEWAMLTGEFHNGPLSVIVPFGLWGVLALGWFFAATGRMLYRNWVLGHPELTNINRFLLVYFLARLVLFLFVVGSLCDELYQFSCLAGLAVSLNAAAKPRVVEEPEEEYKEPLVDMESARARDLV
jgi:hypothetical protein